MATNEVQTFTVFMPSGPPVRWREVARVPLPVEYQPLVTSGALPIGALPTGVLPIGVLPIGALPTCACW